MARLRSSTDRAAGFYPVGWEFDSLRRHSCPALETDDFRRGCDQLRRVGRRDQRRGDGGDFVIGDPTGRRATLSNEYRQAVIARLGDQFVDRGDADPDEHRPNTAA